MNNATLDDDAIGCVASSATTGAPAHDRGARFVAPEHAPPDGAQLYLYRPSGRSGMRHVLRVAIDGQALPAGLPDGRWQRVILAPGVHALGVDDPRGVVRCRPPVLYFHAQPGQTLYAECLVLPVDMDLAWNRAYARLACDVALQSAPRAHRDMQGLRRCEPQEATPGPRPPDSARRVTR